MTIASRAADKGVMARIFSGIQPTGIAHLGNYLGAIRNWVDLQDRNEAIYCLVDLHALTTWQDPKALREQTLQNAALLIACGIDPARSILFHQSAVHAHTRLAWIFNCVSRMGWLSRMTQFKDKAGKDREAVSTGLFVYPNLMAADILAYKATEVPVGDDQSQHLELANDIAQKFNHDYEVNFFPIILPRIMKSSARIMSLRDGTKKMSKSDASDQSRINLTDNADTIAQKIRRARTDPLPLPEISAGLEGRHEAQNLVAIFAAVTGISVDQALREHGGKGFGAFKEALAEVLVEFIAPIRLETKRLADDASEMERILRSGSRRAAAIAEPIVVEVERIVGLLPA